MAKVIGLRALGVWPFQKKDYFFGFAFIGKDKLNMNGGEKRDDMQQRAVSWDQACGRCGNNITFYTWNTHPTYWATGRPQNVIFGPYLQHSHQAN